jgi:hypothetical protein
LPCHLSEKEEKEVRGLFELGRQRQFGFNLPNGEERIPQYNKSHFFFHFSLA